MKRACRSELVYQERIDRARGDIDGQFVAGHQPVLRYHLAGVFYSGQSE